MSNGTRQENTTGKDKTRQCKARRKNTRLIRVEEARDGKTRQDMERLEQMEQKKIRQDNVPYRMACLDKMGQENITRTDID